MSSSRRALVTGGAGFIGSRLVRELVRRGVNVVVADNLTTVHSLALIDDVLEDVEFVHVDIRCPEDFARLPRGPYDQVFHLAASFANALSIEHPVLDTRTNVEGTLHVIRFAVQSGCGLFVYTGSSSSYGDAPLPLREDGPVRPATPYAMSKLTAEHHVRSAPIPSVVFRLFNVYGPGDPPGAYRNAIPNMCRALVRPDGAIRIFGADATRDFTYVDDVVRVLCDASRAVGRVVNVATGVERRVTDVARTLTALYDCPADRILVTERRSWDRVVRRVADVSALAQLYGGVPSTPLEVGLRATVQWLHDQGYCARPPVR